MTLFDAVCDMPNDLAAAHIFALLAATETDPTRRAEAVSESLQRLPLATSHAAAVDPARWGTAVAVLLPSLSRAQFTRVLNPIPADHFGLNLIRHILPVLLKPARGADQAYFAIMQAISRVVCDRNAATEYQHQQIVRDLLDLLPLIRPVGRRTIVLDKAYDRAVLLDQCSVRDVLLESIGLYFADSNHSLSGYNAICHMSDPAAKARALCRLAAHPGAADDRICLHHTLATAFSCANAIGDADQRMWTLIAVADASRADTIDPQRTLAALSQAAGYLPT